MKSLRYKFVTGALLASVAAVPVSAMADSNSASGASPSAAVNLDFRVEIPGILRFQVGGAGGVNEILFEPAVDTLGDGSDVVATSGGDLGPGTVTVDLFSNAGPVTITETNNSGGAGLRNTNGAGADYIPYSEILTVSSDPTNFDAPTLSNAGGGTSTPTPTSGNNKVTNYPAETWTYTYDNTAVYPAGDYGTSARGGRVTYTAASP